MPAKIVITLSVQKDNDYQDTGFSSQLQGLSRRALRTFGDSPYIALFIQFDFIQFSGFEFLPFGNPQPF